MYVRRFNTAHCGNEVAHADKSQSAGNKTWRLSFLRRTSASWMSSVIIISKLGRTTNEAWSSEMPCCVLATNASRNAPRMRRKTASDCRLNGCHVCDMVVQYEFNIRVWQLAVPLVGRCLRCRLAPAPRRRKCLLYYRYLRSTACSSFWRMNEWT